jgi:hypothetical protein
MTKLGKNDDNDVSQDGSVFGWPILWERLLSLAVAIIDLLVVAWALAPESPPELAVTIIVMALPLVFFLACIWFSDDMAEYYAGSFLRPTTGPSSPTLVRLGGWVLLLLPILFVLATSLMGSRSGH